jgi:hypothetical protein
MRFILFTKTPWDEPPRLRHQVALMLARRNHEVVFFEKVGLPGTWSARNCDGIRVVRHGELLHHQLRPTDWIAALNAAYCVRNIRRATDWNEETVVLNFNYDYDFLRRLFPENVLLTIVNDDFIAGARPHMRRQARRVYERTVRHSDHVLTVSTSLYDQAAQFTNAVSTFFPWARRPYLAPPIAADRPELLYWGYVNDRLDWRAVRHVLDAGIVINFVGPINDDGQAESMMNHANARHRGAATLDELSAIIDRCAASILPYDINGRYGEMVAAITVNNRAFELLATGLPLLYADLPGLLTAPPGVITRCGTPQAYVDAFLSARTSFDDRQESIRDFLEDHTEDARYRQLTRLIERASNDRRAHHGARDVRQRA